MYKLSKLFCLLLLLFAVLSAQPTQAPTLHVPPGAQAGPGFDPETSTRAYLATMPADKKARSDAYFEGGYWLILWDFLYGVAISVLLLAMRLSATMRDFAERVTRRRPLQTWIYWA